MTGGEMRQSDDALRRRNTNFPGGMAYADPWPDRPGLAGGFDLAVVFRWREKFFAGVFFS
jgi:hypothetical protein